MRDNLRKIRYMVSELAKEQEERAREPERKKGKWLPHEDEYGNHCGDKCSVCGEWYVMPDGKSKFCPNCGADMRGGELDATD